MIARISGILLTRRPGFVVVDVGGLGYRLFVSLNCFYGIPQEGMPVSLEVRTVVRDDAIHLYGFSDLEEKEAFEALLAVSGIGPKVALGILSGISPGELWKAVRAGDALRLTSVPGIGKKTAARMVVDLEGRLPVPSGEPEEPAAGEGDPLQEDSLSALINLGYGEAAARKAVTAALGAMQGPATLEQLLKLSLKRLSGGKR